MVSLMPRKKQNKSASTAKKQKGKRSGAKSQSGRKVSAKKRKPENEVLPVLNSDKLKELYATMVKCRLLAERAQSVPNPERKSRSICGFEATLVGAGAHLLARDCIALEHSSFVGSLIKGTSLHLIIARNRGLQTGNGMGKSASSTHDGDGAARLSMDSVLSLAAEMKGKSLVTLMFCTQHPEMLIFDANSMALAATEKLPLVCLVESSFDSRLELSNQNASGPYVGADASFYPKIPVDGCDAVAVFRVAQEAIRRAREGHGPAVIECLTSRGSAYAKNQTERTSVQYTAQDPLTFMEEYLQRRDLWSDRWSQAIVAGFNRELSEAFTSLENSAALDAQFDNVYSADGPKQPPTVASAQ
jgi:TPP-dependent pyruvate/acetoin dehydrogenase alpha subunit